MHNGTDKPLVPLIFPAESSRLRAFRGGIRSDPYMEVRLPTLSCSAEHRFPDRHLAVKSSPARPIGIVDDDDSVRDSLRILLESCGYEVLDFPSATEFLQNEPDRPACLVLDMHMPGMNGLELVEILRERGDPVPVIMLSANATDLRRHPAAKNVLHILSKPVGDTELLGCIETALASPVA